jgi:hypothetical protein
MDESRRAQRLRTFKGGSIIFGLAAAVDCTVRNMSASGACLEIKGPVGFPTTSRSSSSPSSSNGIAAWSGEPMSG